MSTEAELTEMQTRRAKIDALKFEVLTLAGGEGGEAGAMEYLAARVVDQEEQIATLRAYADRLENEVSKWRMR